MAALAYIYGLEGNKTQAEEMLPETKPLALKAGHPWLVCLVYVGLNQKDQAMRWLEKAYDQGDFYFNLKRPAGRSPAFGPEIPGSAAAPEYGAEVKVKRSPPLPENVVRLLYE
jgi:hypothetical protein